MVDGWIGVNFVSCEEEEMGARSRVRYLNNSLKFLRFVIYNSFFKLSFPLAVVVAWWEEWEMEGRS